MEFKQKHTASPTRPIRTPCEGGTRRTLEASQPGLSFAVCPFRPEDLPLRGCSELQKLPCVKPGGEQLEEIQ